MTWRPIETAPRDGTQIRLRGNGIFHGVEFVAYWRQPEWPWQTERWWMVIGDRAIQDHAPTHWQPLPAPPEDEG